MYPSMPHAVSTPATLRSVSPSPSNASRLSDPLPYPTAGSSSDFQVERSFKTRSRRQSMVGTSSPLYDSEFAFRESVSRLLSAKNRPSSVAGSIPIDASQLILFFRTKSGITHSLDFPIDVDYNTPPALDVLIAACRPHQTTDIDAYDEQHESLFYPPTLPLTTSLELANHPIMAAIRTTLFPNLPTGHYLTAARDKLEVLTTGSRLGTQSRALRNDGRVATIIITLPVKYRGGALFVKDGEGREERFISHGSKNGDLEWTCFMADCDYEVETVTKGCKMTISYSILLKTFGPSGVSDPLIAPSDMFLDLLAPILNASRGRKIAFNLSHTYNVNPAEVLAESLVPELKGGDSVLYHALKLYKLAPELHFSAGGYFWPVDRTVDFQGDNAIDSAAKHHLRLQNGMSPLGTILPPQSRSTTPALRSNTPAVRGPFSIYGAYGTPEDDETDLLRARVEESGGIPLSEADISVCSDWNDPNPMIGKERVPFVQDDALDKLIVNPVIIVFVP